jgi:hypothetical protein
MACGEAETPSAPHDIEASFRQGYYSPPTNLERSEWEVMYRQFVESSLIVKPVHILDMLVYEIDVS